MGATATAREISRQEAICEERLKTMGAYCRGKSRYMRIMEAIRDGKSDLEILMEVKELDRDTLGVYRRVLAGQCSRGDGQADDIPERIHHYDRRRTPEEMRELREAMFALLDAGEWAEDAGARLGVNAQRARSLYKEWHRKTGKTTRRLRTELGLGGRKIYARK